MSTTIPAQQPRRVWLWAIGLGLGALVLGSVWKAEMKYSAAAELDRAGFWPMEDVFQTVRQDWHKLLKRDTWRVGDTVRWQGPAGFVGFRDLDAFGSALRRLGVKGIDIEDCPELENVDGLRGLASLQALTVYKCPGLRNVDGLKGLPDLEFLCLEGSSALEDVDALHGLTTLKSIDLSGCTKLSPESVAALKAALPTTIIIGP